MHRIRNRINILKEIISQTNSTNGVPITSSVSSLFQLYGLRKLLIKRKLRVVDKPEVVASIVTICGRSIYWPITASLGRLVDMYFEVFHENNHRFDTSGTPLLHNDVVVDVGCCEGYFTMLALEHGASRVFCFEPGELIGNCLKQTFYSEIEAGHVDIVPILLGDSESNFFFQEDPKDPTTGRLLPQSEVEENGKCYQIEMMTLDFFRETRGLEKLDYIKIDVEGAEPQVISGAKETIKRFAPRIAVAVYHEPHHAQQLKEMIADIRHDYHFKLKGLVEYGGIVRPVMLHCHVPDKY